jgi:hypothetical protein
MQTAAEQARRQARSAARVPRAKVLGRRSAAMTAWRAASPLSRACGPARGRAMRRPGSCRPGIAPQKPHRPGADNGAKPDDNTKRRGTE